jgi:thiamine-phosphate pyrophosphorylase
LGRYQFTAAAGRAIAAAARWTGGGETGSISPTELLLGLLDESESRAAEMLAARGISTPTVLARWPAVSCRSNGENAKAAILSPELDNAFAEAALRLADFPRPLELATEHLLLGLVAGRGELSGWLGEQGFDANALADEICRHYGYDRNVQGSGSYNQRVPGVQGSGNEPASIAFVGNALCGVPQEGSADRDGAPVRGSRDEPPANHSVGNALFGVPRPADGSSDAAAHSATGGILYRNADDRTALLRILDASANRAREGLRVLEDYVRFVWNDRHLTSQFKQLRHDLASALTWLPADGLLVSRDTLGDVGTTVSTTTERDRPDLTSVMTANAKRLQESLRSIEEYGKVLSPQLSAEIEQLRYRTYTLERALAATSLGMRHLERARLYVLIDGRPTVQAFGELVQTLIAAGVDVLQLRDKQLADRELLDRACLLRNLTAGTKTLFIMNDRPDLAVLSQADGVHVGQEELSVDACRAIVGPSALIGVSTHSLEQARQAVLDGANYIGVGPTFPSLTKPFATDALRGPELLRAVQAEIRLPAFAIGGVDLENVDSVLAAGCPRIAVSGGVLSADDPGMAAHELLARLGPPR